MLILINRFYKFSLLIASLFLSQFTFAQEEVIEENILSNNIGFLIDCNLNFNDGDLNQLLFEQIHLFYLYAIKLFLIYSNNELLLSQ